jgi:hypothetical protein
MSVAGYNVDPESGDAVAGINQSEYMVFKYRHIHGGYTLWDIIDKRMHTMYGVVLLKTTAITCSCPKKAREEKCEHMLACEKREQGRVAVNLAHFFRAVSRFVERGQRELTGADLVKQRELSAPRRKEMRMNPETYPWSQCDPEDYDSNASPEDQAEMAAARKQQAEVTLASMRKAVAGVPSYCERYADRPLPDENLYRCACCGRTYQLTQDECGWLYEQWTLPCCGSSFRQMTFIRRIADGRVFDAEVLDWIEPDPALPEWFDEDDRPFWGDIEDVYPGW